MPRSRRWCSCIRRIRLASVAVLNMDDAGQIAPAAAMGMMIFYTNVGARLVHALAARGVLRRTQAWRAR
jgi:iron(III) transport system permease protein